MPNLSQYRNTAVRMLFAGIITLILASCNRQEEKSLPFSTDTYLADTTALGVVSVSFIKLTAQMAGHSEFNDYMKYPIQLYRIVYHTRYKDKPVLASGLISFPLNPPASMPELLVGNGLIFSNDEAPSNFSLPDHYTGFEFIGAMGYLTMIPDMLGFGASKDVLFPIHNYDYSATTMIDFYHACEEFIRHKEIKVSGRTFLSGYSQGAYIAVSTLKMAEEDISADITFDAAAVGAGGFDLVGLLDLAVENNYYSAPSHLALLLSSYNTIYDWNKPLSYFFKEPYAAEIPNLLSGTFTREEIDRHLPMHLDSLLTTHFLNGLADHSETEVIDALSDNSVYDWAPSTTLKIIHSIHDERIPFSDSEKMYNTMKANGAVNVTLTPIDSEGHFNSGFTFMKIVIPWLDSLRVN